MSEQEQFDIKKMGAGFINPVTWSKSLVYFVMIAAILFCVVTVYRAYFMKTGSNISKPTHNPFNIMWPGSGNIGTLDQSQDVKTDQKTELQKSKWWIPHLYTSISGGARMKTSGSSLNFDSFEPEIRADVLGLRWDWN